MQQQRKAYFSISLIILMGLLISAAPLLCAALPRTTLAQEVLPAPPADQTLIYLNEGGALAPLAFETGATPLHIESVAKSDKRSYLELKGEHAAKMLATDAPRFYLFVKDEASAKPPFLVRLNAKRGGRRVDAMAQKGYSGFAIGSEDIIKPNYRVIRREGGMQFMEISPRQRLAPGEYAIIGTDITRIVTFRIA